MRRDSRWCRRRDGGRGVRLCLPGADVLFYLDPVDPKPPSPRTVSDKLCASTNPSARVLPPSFSTHLNLLHLWRDDPLQNELRDPIPLRH